MGRCPARIVPVDPERPDMAIVSQAAGLIAAGGVVAYPTDTVYGLAADPYNEQAVEKIFAIKGRAAAKALTLILAGPEQLHALVAEIPKAAEILTEAFWPGPLTIVFPLAPQLHLPALRGSRTVAVRVPASALCRSLAHLCGGPITATSANLSGEPEPTHAAQVAAALGERLDLILDGGPSPLAVPSTLVDATAHPPVVLREGAIPAERIMAVLAEGRP
ncbi:MAG: threonylcarbamoyl-AMP synthase [Calditrichaeota bacterium]|nr:threonylcarbamoyl-AMP synthase [Calditrichota bacterium]